MVQWYSSALALTKTHVVCNLTRHTDLYSMAGSEALAAWEALDADDAVATAAVAVAASAVSTATVAVAAALAAAVHAAAALATNFERRWWAAQFRVVHSTRDVRQHDCDHRRRGGRATPPRCRRRRSHCDEEARKTITPRKEELEP